MFKINLQALIWCKYIYDKMAKRTQHKLNVKLTITRNSVIHLKIKPLENTFQSLPAMVFWNASSFFKMLNLTVKIGHGHFALFLKQKSNFKNKIVLNRIGNKLSSKV